MEVCVFNYDRRIFLAQIIGFVWVEGWLEHCFQVLLCLCTFVYILGFCFYRFAMPARYMAIDARDVLDDMITGNNSAYPESSACVVGKEMYIKQMDISVSQI